MSMPLLYNIEKINNTATIQSSVSMYTEFYSCLRLRFPDVETNPGPRRPVLASCRTGRVCPGMCGSVREP